ncbi:MAG TPA: hypothetical protein VL285_26010 [Bryobacteraceae bacterium]|nr:hypothetical protein [Bryobacteraceae bacterium]
MDDRETALFRRLEFAIISVLAHYGGHYKEEMVEWYSALRLGLPQLTDERQLREVFVSLSTEGIVDLADFPVGEAESGIIPFTSTLTPAGLAYWNSLQADPRVQL